MIDWKDQKDRPIIMQDGDPVEIIYQEGDTLIGITRDEKCTNGFGIDRWDLNGSHREWPRMNLKQDPKRVEYNGWANLQLLKEDHSEIYDHSSIYVYESENKAIHDAHEGGEHNDAIAIPLTVTIEGDKVTIHGEGKVNKAKE